MSARERDAADVGAGLWKGMGMWAWVLFRISGLVLVAYLLVHLWVISQGRDGGPLDLDNLFGTFDTPFLVFLGSLIVAALIYHALNGVRIVLMDVGCGRQPPQGRVLGLHGRGGSALAVRLESLRAHLLGA